VAPRQSITVVEPELVRLSSHKLASLAAGGNERLIVTAFAHDALCKPLDPSAHVSIQVPGLTAIGPVVHIGGNEFQRSFAPAPLPGAFRVAVAFDGWAPRVRPTVSYLSLASSQFSGVVFVPTACERARAIVSRLS